MRFLLPGAGILRLYLGRVHALASGRHGKHGRLSCSFACRYWVFWSGSCFAPMGSRSFLNSWVIGGRMRYSFFRAQPCAWFTYRFLAWLAPPKKASEDTVG